MKKLLLLIFLTVISCAPIPSTTKFTDKNVSIEKNNVNVGLIVNCSKLQLLGYFDTYCNNFTLVIQNKNNQNIEVNWNKSFYISNGQSNGGFMYGGITYLLRNAPKQNDIIFANNNFSKIVRCGSGPDKSNNKSYFFTESVINENLDKQPTY